MRPTLRCGIIPHRGWQAGFFGSESALRYVHAYDGETELRWDLAVGLRRSDDALVDAVNEALTRLKRDGSLARIYQAYGIDYRQP